MNEPVQRKWRFSRFVYLTLLALGMASAYLLPLLPYRMPLCLFKLMTGYPCAGCGMTRAVVAAAHGHFREAFEWHPLGLAFFIVAWLVALAFGYELLTDKPLPWNEWFKRRGMALAWALFLAFLLLWLLRLSYLRWGQWLPVPLKVPL